MARPAILESFDAASFEPEAPVSLSDDWLSGHAAGRAEAGAEGEADAAKAAAALTQMLSDMAFTFAEARAQVLASLQPLIGKIADGLLPGMAEAARVPVLLDLVMAAAEADSRTAMILTVSPALHDSLAPLLPLGAGPPIELRADASLPEGRAQLAAETGQGTVLDFDAYLAELRAVLAALTNEPEMRLTNG